jgi:hypothetical protein
MVRWPAPGSPKPAPRFPLHNRLKKERFIRCVIVLKGPLRRVEPTDETDVKELPTTDDRSVEYAQSQKFPANHLEVKFLYWTLPQYSLSPYNNSLTIM